MDRHAKRLIAWLPLLAAFGVVITAIVLFSSGKDASQRSANAEYTATTLMAGEPTRPTVNSRSVSPTATYTLGMLGECPRVTDFNGPLCTGNMWRGIINGDIIQVMGGQEGVEGDMGQGIAIVMNLSKHDQHIYVTTQRAGPVRIVAVNGTRVTLIPANYETPVYMTPDTWLTPWTPATQGPTYVLDLVTRQWISPPPSFTPVPTPTWGSGMVPCWGSGWGRGWFIADTTCWEGTIDGYLVDVVTGREVGANGDAGFLSVDVYDPTDRIELSYRRQDALPSPLIITSVQGTVVYMNSWCPFDIKGWLPGSTPTP